MATLETRLRDLATGIGTKVKAVMTLINGNEKLILKFDCKACEMHVVGKMKKGVKLNLGTIRPATGF